MGSVIKKRRKRMSKKKHRKLRVRPATSVSSLTCNQGIRNPVIVMVAGFLFCLALCLVRATVKPAPAMCRCGLGKA